MAVSTTGVFKGLKTPRDVLDYNLMYGVTDFSNLDQFDYYEKGYPLLVVTKIPTFMEDLAKYDDGFKSLINNYVHVLEHDFKGLDGLDNIQGEANGEITNGIRSLQIINKVTKPATTTINMQFVERSGSLMTKGNELYLTGIKDPDTQYKHYHGLIDAYRQGSLETCESAEKPGPDKEVFEFLYMVTDNTGTEVERAFLLASAQANIADFATLYNTEKGQIEFPTIQLSFNVFPINNNMVYVKAQKALMAMRNQRNTTNSRLVVDSNNYKYKAIENIELVDKGAEGEFTLSDEFIREGGKWGDMAKVAANSYTGSYAKANTKTSNQHTNSFGDGNTEHMFQFSNTDASGTT